MSKAFELFIGLKIVVAAESADEVRAAGRKLAARMRVVEAREVRVRETLPEHATGSWAIVDGELTKEPLEVATFEELSNHRAQRDDLASVAEADGALFIYGDAQNLPKDFPEEEVVRGRHGGVWIAMEAIARMMSGRSE